MQKYGEIRKSADKVKRTYVRKALPEGQPRMNALGSEHLFECRSTDDHPHFLHHAANLASVLRNIIFVDQVCFFVFFSSLEYRFTSLQGRLSRISKTRSAPTSRRTYNREHRQGSSRLHF